MEQLIKEIEKLLAQGVTIEDIGKSFQVAFTEFEATEKAKAYEKSKLNKLAVIVGEIASYVQEFHPDIKEFVTFDELTTEELKEIDAKIEELVIMLKGLKDLDNTLVQFANSLI